MRAQLELWADREKTRSQWYNNSPHKFNTEPKWSSASQVTQKNHSNQFNTKFCEIAFFILLQCSIFSMRSHQKITTHRSEIAKFLMPNTSQVIHTKDKILRLIGYIVFVYEVIQFYLCSETLFSICKKLQAELLWKQHSKKKRFQEIDWDEWGIDNPLIKINGS